MEKLQQIPKEKRDELIEILEYLDSPDIDWRKKEEKEKYFLNESARLARAWYDIKIFYGLFYSRIKDAEIRENIENKFDKIYKKYYR